MPPIELTENQKLQALAAKHYSGLVWEPKTNDYYTTSRPDLELYQIVEVTDTVVKTKYCHPSFGKEISEWTKGNFLKDFGERRVWVPDYVFDTPAQPVPVKPVGDVMQGFKATLQAKVYYLKDAVPHTDQYGYRGALENVIEFLNTGVFESENVKPVEGETIPLNHNSFDQDKENQEAANRWFSTELARSISKNKTEGETITNNSQNKSSE